MAQRMVVGKLVNEIGFEIDKKSVSNLKAFQKRLANLKKQMKGLSGGVGLNISMGGQSQKQTQKFIRRNTEFKQKIENKASKTLFADRLRSEDKLAKEVSKKQKLTEIARRKQAVKEITSGPADKKASNAIKQQMQARAIEEKKVMTQLHKDAIFLDRKRTQSKSKAEKRAEIIKGREVDKGVALSGFGNLKSGDLRRFRSDFDALTNSFSRGTISSQAYRKQTQRLMGDFRRMNSGVKSLNQRFLNLRHSMLGLGVAGGAIAGGTAVVQTGQAFEAMQAKMLLATGGKTEAADAIALARREAKRLGLDLLSTADSLARLGIAAKDKISDSEFKELFTSFVELGTAAQLPKEQMDRGMRAMEQMLNKGTLMSEEVKGQFSEAIPGGIRIFADALEMSEQEFFKAMETGKLMAKDVLPKVAKEMAKTARTGGALTTALSSNRAAMNRMITVYQDFKKAFFDAGFSQVMSQMYQTATNLMIALTPVAEFIATTLYQAIKTVTIPFRVLIAVMADLAEMFGSDKQSDIAKMAAEFTGFALAIWGLRKGAALVGAIFTKIATPFRFITGLIATMGTGGAATAAALTTFGGRLLWLGGWVLRISKFFTFWGIALTALGFILDYFGIDVFKVMKDIGGYIKDAFGDAIDWVIKKWEQLTNLDIKGLLGFGDSPSNVNTPAMGASITANAKVMQAQIASTGPRTMMPVGGYYGMGGSREVTVKITGDEEGIGKLVNTEIVNNEDRVKNDILSNTGR